MNTQEALKLVEQMGEYEPFVDEPISKKSVLNTISQINKPQKVVVKKFVAKWYEKNKDDLNTAIYKAITEIHRKINSDNDGWLDTFEGWLAYEDNSISILVQMQLFGYEIEQEQLYTVEIPDPHSCYNYRFLSKNSRGVFLSADCDRGWERLPENQLTESEIKQDFEWAWQFAKEVE